MSVLATDPNELILIYNSDTRNGEQVLGYARAAEDDIREIDISKTKLGDTVWVSIAEGLGKSFNEILSTNHPDTPDLKYASFDTNDWLKILEKNPVLLQRPIAIRGNMYKQIQSPSEMTSFFKPDSAGLDE